ncbi:MAG: ABC transporter permease subunit [Hyphomicrobiales bacterium]|nr:ABC transporter permease subunit [Hyphomicrobiales bacterium]
MAEIFGLTTVFSFGPGGWGRAMLAAAGMTLAVALTGYAIGGALGVLGAFAKTAGGTITRGLADAYTSILRGIPDLLVIYLFYFGSGAVLTPLGHLFGASGFVSMPGFVAGALAIGIVSGAYQTEVFRGAYRAVAKGEIEAARAVGMSGPLMLRRILAPLVLRHAIAGLGNVWQLVLKESALVSVTGLVEILRQSQIGAGSTRQPFTFFLGAAILFLVISSVSEWLSSFAERHFSRGLRRA